MFIGPDDRPGSRNISDLDLGCGRTAENTGPCQTTAAADVVFALMNSTEPAPIDALVFGKRAGEIIAKAASLARKARP
jgi:hypothetical protein